MSSPFPRHELHPPCLPEPESKVLRVLAETQRFAAYLSLHSGIQHIYIPFADTASRNSRHSPGTADLMLDVASKMAASQRRDGAALAALCCADPYDVTSTPPPPPPPFAINSGFAFGLARELNSYGADGTSVDYMAGVAKVWMSSRTSTASTCPFLHFLLTRRQIPISLAAEVWGDGDDTTKACFDLFNPRSHTVQVCPMPPPPARAQHTPTRQHPSTPLTPTTLSAPVQVGG